MRGAGLGRRLGFPTANLRVARADFPPWGVYRVEASWEGRTHAGVCSVGVRPTLGPSGEAAVEVHVLDFAGYLYGRRLEVHFFEKLRDEARFDSLGALTEQIRRDVAAVRAACRCGAAGAAGRRGRPAAGRGGTRRRPSGRRAGPS